MSAEEIETDFMDYAVCPHCGHEHSDSACLQDTQKKTCEKCGNPFMAFRNYEITYTTRKIS